MPNAKDRPLLPLQPGVNSKVQKIPQAIKVLTTSAWVSFFLLNRKYPHTL